MHVRASSNAHPYGRRTFLRITGSVLVVAMAATRTVGAQNRQERSGLVIFWGLVPSELVDPRHALEQMHGGAPAGGGRRHHLVIAVYDATAQRPIGDAIVRARVFERGIDDDAPPRYLTPMRINDQPSYGQVFGVALPGPYLVKVRVRASGRTEDVEFDFTAASPHRGGA